MSAAPATSPPCDAFDGRVLPRHVSWATYERLRADDEEQRVPRMSYDRGLLELVSASMGHEVDGGALEHLVNIVTATLNIPIRDVGSTTFCWEDLHRGFEADYRFYIQSEERIRGQSEYWCCEVDRVTIFVLGRDELQESATSMAIPALTSDILTRFLIVHHTMLSPDWFHMVRDWAQSAATS